MQEVYITYVYDGDKRVAKETFTGSLAINGKPLTTETTSEEVAKLADVELVTVMKGFYMGKGDGMLLMAYYPQSAIGQFGFSFAKM